uniref:Uncharacterized protein TCIL3000_8_7800 n=1 Tax=Trypanosoma congolense (strain IL3000) TaxID=1068625 RepID=G0UT37_TRYCI|nr:unnamed protein product [Trypanosoma congolense IL3000]
MPPPARGQNAGKNRGRGSLFILEGVPLYDSPENSSDDERLKGPMPHYRPPPPPPWNSENKSPAVNQQQQQWCAQAQDQMMLQRNWYEQQQALLHQRQQELFHLECQRSHPQKQQQTQPRQWHEVPQSREKPYIPQQPRARNRNAKECPAKNNDSPPPVEKIGDTKCFLDDSHSGPTVMMSAYQLGTPPAITAPRTHKNQNPHYTTLPPPHATHDIDDSDSDDENYYMMEESVEMSTGDARHLVNRNRNSVSRAHHLQPDAAGMTKFDSTLFMEREGAVVRTVDCHMSEVDSSRRFMTSDYNIVDRNVFSHETPHNNGAARSRWRAVSTGSQGSLPPPSRSSTAVQLPPLRGPSVTPPFGNLTDSNSPNGDYFRGDYDFLPVELQPHTPDDYSGFDFPGDALAPPTPLHFSNESRVQNNARRETAPSPPRTRSSKDGGQQRSRRRHPSSKQEPQGGERSGSLPPPPELPSTKSKTKPSTRSERLHSYILSAEITDKDEYEHKHKVIDSDNPHRWILL